jgi:hypothetical protein
VEAYAGETKKKNIMEPRCEINWAMPLMLVPTRRLRSRTRLVSGQCVSPSVTVLAYRKADSRVSRYSQRLRINQRCQSEFRTCCDCWGTFLQGSTSHMTPESAPSMDCHRQLDSPCGSTSQQTPPATSNRRITHTAISTHVFKP